MDGEKRGAPRKFLEYPAGIDAGDGTPLRACVLSDISKTGVRVRVSEPTELPETVTLVLSSNGVFRRCRVAWAEGSDLGLEFLDKQATDLPRRRPASS